MAIRGLEPLDNRLLAGLEFCSKAYGILDEIRSGPGGIEELRLRRSRRSKKLLEEILPLAAYVQSRHSPGRRLRIRWVDGNQCYDARLRCAGALVEAMNSPRGQYLEVTTAVHVNAHLVREHLHYEGFAFDAKGTRRDPRTRKTVSAPTVYENSERLAEIADLIKARIAEKTSKVYSAHTSLIVRCEVGLPLLEDEWQQVVQAVRPEPHRFREVVLVEELGCRVTTV